MSSLHIIFCGRSKRGCLYLKGGGNCSEHASLLNPNEHKRLSSCTQCSIINFARKVDDAFPRAQENITLQPNSRSRILLKNSKQKMKSNVTKLKILASSVSQTDSGRTGFSQTDPRRIGSKQSVLPQLVKGEIAPPPNGTVAPSLQALFCAALDRINTQSPKALQAVLDRRAPLDCSQFIKLVRALVPSKQPPSHRAVVDLFMMLDTDHNNLIDLSESRALLADSNLHGSATQIRSAARGNTSPLPPIEAPESQQPANETGARAQLPTLVSSPAAPAGGFVAMRPGVAGQRAPAKPDPAPPSVRPAGLATAAAAAAKVSPTPPRSCTSPRKSP